jgi:hypothetical protein
LVSAGQPRLLKALNGVRLEFAQGDSIAPRARPFAVKSLSFIRMLAGR